MKQGERKPISKVMRQRVYNKYNGHCAYCGKPIAMKDMQVDHITPVMWTIYGTKEQRVPIEQMVADGTMDSLENYMPACRSCNYYKGMGDINSLRHRILTQLDHTCRSSFQVRLAMQYGMIEYKPWDGKFYFERTEEEKVLILYYMERLDILSEVYNCDCLDFMRIQPDKAFDLAIADPPYGINAPNMRMGEQAGYPSTATLCKKGRLNAGAGKLKDRALNTMPCDWDATPPTQEFFDELKRISKNQIIWGGNYFPLPPTRCIVCWDKKQSWDNFSQIELAWTSFDFPAKIFRKGNTGGSVPDMRMFPKIHPTQKPVELYIFLLQTFAKEGDVIFDPMMGSQSSRIAAYNLGFDYFGCEIDKDYFDDGCKRFNEECHGVSTLPDGRSIQQLSIFETNDM